MSNRILVLLCAALLSTGAVACGSDDDGDSGGSATASSESKPLSKKAYEKKVSKASDDFGAKSDKLDLSDPSSPKDFKRSLDGLVGLLDTFIARIDGLEPPAAVASQHDQLVSVVEEYRSTLDEHKDDLASGDKKKIKRSADEIADASTKFSADFERVGQSIDRRLEK